MVLLLNGRARSASLYKVGCQIGTIMDSWFGQDDIEGPAVPRTASPPLQQLSGLARGAEDVAVLAKFMDDAHLAHLK